MKLLHILLLVVSTTLAMPVKKPTAMDLLNSAGISVEPHIQILKMQVCGGNKVAMYGVTDKKECESKVTDLINGYVQGFDVETDWTNRRSDMEDMFLKNMDKYFVDAAFLIGGPEDGPEMLKMMRKMVGPLL